MTNIAIIYMGGTFGCVSYPLTPMPAENFLEKLRHLDHLQQQELSFFAAPSIKDSTELYAADWLALSLLLQELSDRYQHFIIIHGTDTLSYASAFLHHIFKQQYRIILTGSQLPLLTADGTQLLKPSDAWGNLTFAIQQIKNIEPSVYLAFDQKLHLGYQTYKQHTEDFNAFSSSTTPTQVDTLEADIIVTPQYLEDSRDIRLLNLYLQPSAVESLLTDLQNINHNPPHILVLQGFGSGNIPYHPKLQEILESLISHGCWVIVSSQVWYGPISQKYSTGSWLNNINLVFDPHHSQADLYARATLLYLQYSKQKNWQQYWV